MPKRADQAAVVSPSRRPNHSQAWTPASLAITASAMVARTSAWTHSVRWSSVGQPVSVMWNGRGLGSGRATERVEGEVRGGDLTGGPSYLTALAYLSIMTPERAADALHARVSALADEAQRLRETLDRTGAPEVHMIEAHYLLARLQHDRNWLTATALRIHARELAWP
jgi:hypothetical protein